MRLEMEATIEVAAPAVGSDAGTVDGTWGSTTAQQTHQFSIVLLLYHIMQTSVEGNI